MSKKEELVEDFIKKLIDHINVKSSEEASQSCDNSCYGMESYRTENELSDSIRSIFKTLEKE